MTDPDEIKESTDIFNVINEHDKEIRENIFEASGIYFSSLFRPKEELEVLFAMERILEKWNLENKDTLCYTTEVIREVPKIYGGWKKLVDHFRGTWYGSVIQIRGDGRLDYDYINPKRIVVLFPEYRKLADELSILLKPKEGVVEDYNWQNEIYDWRIKKI